VRRATWDVEGETWAWYVGRETWDKRRETWDVESGTL